MTDELLARFADTRTRRRWLLVALAPLLLETGYVGAVCAPKIMHAAPKGQGIGYATKTHYVKIGKAEVADNYRALPWFWLRGGLGIGLLLVALFVVRRHIRVAGVLALVGTVGLDAGVALVAPGVYLLLLRHVLAILPLTLLAHLVFAIAFAVKPANWWHRSPAELETEAQMNTEL